ncbi:UNVERIFIED_ORG: teichuronic acid biosynthesis glycosyltransferase TuaH [Arthrobacter sp. UYCu721]
MSVPELLILGTADWNQPIATNQHYMTRELAKSFNTTFVESLGLRRPEFSIRDLRRIWERLRKDSASTSIRLVPENVEVVAPLVVPIHDDFLSGINRRLLKRGKVRSWATGDSPRVFWTYSPVTYGLEQYADVKVYHCVDLLGEFPGIDRELVSKHERRLAAAGVQAIASSEVVRSHLIDQGFANPIYWPNVADAEKIILAANEVSVPRKPSAIFAGNLTSKKVDFQLLQELLDAGVQVHLAGPIAQGGGDAEDLLKDLVSNGAKYHGMLPLESLAKIMAACTVGLIPYELNAYTRGVSPLKVYEYLAAGLCVVSSPVPSVEPHHGHVKVEATRIDFVKTVLSTLNTPDSSVLNERARLAELHSWSGRGSEARNLLSGLLTA